MNRPEMTNDEGSTNDETRMDRNGVGASFARMSAMFASPKSAALALAVSVAAISGCGGQANPVPLFLGHVGTLSGVEGHAGKQAERGMQLALADLGTAASEGLAGRPLVVRHVDAGGNVDALEAAAARLVSVNRAVGLLGGLTSSEALRLERVRVPVLSPCGYRTSGMSDMLFTTGLAPSRQGELLARHLAAEAAGPVVLVVDTRRPESQALAESFKKSWSEAAAKNAAAGRLVEISFGKEPSFEDVASRADQAEPTGIVFAGEPADFRAFKRLLKTPKAAWVYAGDDGTLSPADLRPGETVLLATALARDKQAAKIEEFAKKYRDKFQDEPTVHAVLAYDNARLFVEALQKAQSSAADKVQEELLKIKDFAGVPGALSFAGERHLRRPAFIARMSADGPATALKMIPP
jgi:branched-chain amino acid transport system substrate-binding protein